MLTYTLIDPNNSNNIVIVEFTENVDGTVTILMKQEGTLLGDFRGLFFDWPDNDSLIGDLNVDSFSGDGLIPADPLSYELVQSNENVTSAGSPSNTVNGLPSTPYDVGIELGSQGKAVDDIQEVTLILSRNSGDPLTLADFEDVTLGVRVMSVEEQEGDDRKDSLKLEKDPEDDCLMGHVDFTEEDVEAWNFLDILPAGVMVTAENIDDADEIFTMGEVGFIDNGASLHKGVGASSQTISPGSHVDTQTGFNPNGMDENGNVTGEAEEIKISFKEDEFPDGILNIKLWITRLFPNEGTGDDNESLRWTTYKDGNQVATDTYEASDNDPELFGASHAVELMIDTGEEFDEIVLTALRYNDDAADNGGTKKDSSDFLLAGFWYKYKIPPENNPPEVEKETRHVTEPMEGFEDDPDPLEGNLLDGASDLDGDTVYMKDVEGQPFAFTDPIVLTQDKDGKAYGTLTVHSNGEYSFDLDEAAANHLAQGAMEMLTYNFSVVDRLDPNDPDALMAMNTIMINIWGANDAPEIKKDIMIMVRDVMDDMEPDPQMGTKTNGNIMREGKVMDPDDGDVVSLFMVNGVTITQNDQPIDIFGGANGKIATLYVSLNGDYMLVANADNPKVHELNHHEYLKVHIDFKVEDKGWKQDTGKIWIKVKGTNDSPDAEDNFYSTHEDAAGEAPLGEYASGNIIDDDTGAGKDSDPDGDILFVAAIKPEDHPTSPLEVTGPDSLKDINLNVTKTLSVDGVFEVEITTNAGDPNEGVALLTIMSNGDWTLTEQSGDPFGAMDNGEVAFINLGYIVNDNENPEKTKMDMADVTIKVFGKDDEEPNDPPIAIDDCAMTLEGIPIPNLDVFRLGDPDKDFDPNNDPIMINSFDGVSPFGAIITDLNPNDGFLTYTPVDGFVGFDTFTYDIKDVPGGLVSNRATVIVMVGKIYDLDQSFGVNGTNNKHHQGKDGLLDPLTGILVAAPFEGKDPEPIHMIDGKDPQDIAPTGLGLADVDDVDHAHVSSLDWTSNFTLNSGLNQYQLDMKTTPFSSFPDEHLNNSGFATFVDFDTSAIRNILVDFTDEEGNQANFVVSLGTNGDDLINGDLPNDGGDPDRSDQDLISGFGGDDIINSGDDDDVVYGDEKTSFRAPGDDTVNGGGGRDLIYGDNLVLDKGYKGGQDMLFGDAGDDVIWGDARFRGPSEGGEDLIRGGAGRDLLYGDGAILQAFSSAASDRIFGDAGNDDIYGDAWKMIGGTGAVDELRGGDGQDFIYGDAKWMEAGSVGADDAVGQGGSVDGKHSGPFGGLYGGGGNDYVYGDGEQVKEDSKGGNDDIFGGGGADRLYGDAGAIYDLQGNLAEAGLIDSQGGNDSIRGNAGNDFIFGDAEVGQETLAAGSLVAGDDTIEGGTGNDNLWGDFFLVLDDSGLDSNITATHPGGADTFVYDFEGINNLDLGDDNIFDFNMADGDIIRFENLLDGGKVLDSGALADASEVSADIDGIAIDFTDARAGNLTTITLFGIAFNGGTEISDYVPEANLDFA